MFLSILPVKLTAYLKLIDFLPFPASKDVKLLRLVVTSSPLLGGPSHQSACSVLVPAKETEELVVGASYAVTLIFDKKEQESPPPPWPKHTALPMRP